MSAQRKFRDPSAAGPTAAAPAWPQSSEGAYRDSPARLQQQALAAALDGQPEPYVQTLPRAVRLAILLGGPAALWAIIIAAVAAVA